MTDQSMSLWYADWLQTKVAAWVPAASENAIKAAAELRRLHDKCERLAHNYDVLENALWKACGDDKEIVDAYIESQGELK